MSHTKELFLMDNKHDGESGHVYVSGAPFVPDEDPLYHADFCGENADNDAFLYMLAPLLLKAAGDVIVDLDLHASTHGPGPDRRRDALKDLVNLAKERGL